MDEIVAVAIKNEKISGGKKFAPTPHSELPQVQKTKKNLALRSPGSDLCPRTFLLSDPLEEGTLRSLRDKEGRACPVPFYREYEDKRENVRE